MSGEGVILMMKNQRGEPTSAVLATDYDGTLAERGVVAAATWEAVERWRATGRRLILVTGRELDDLARTCPRLDLFERIVAENGAWLAERGGSTGRALADRPPASFVAALRAAGVEPISVGKVIVATWQPHEATIARIIAESGLPLRVILNKRALMILPDGVDKATGLRAALAELAVDPRAVAAIGDAENDMALFEAAGLTIAVANAWPPLQERADVVTVGERGAGVVEWIDSVLTRSSRTRV